MPLGVLGVTVFGATSIFNSNDSQSYSKPNSVHVQKVNDNQAKLCCNSIKTSNSEFLFNKSQTGESYQYDLTNLTGDQKYYGFNSRTNIEFSDGVSNNSQLCGAVTSAIAAPSIAATASAVGAVGGAAVAVAPAAAGIAGAASAAAGLGAATGVKVGAAIAVTAVAAAPVAVIAAGILGAIYSSLNRSFIKYIRNFHY